MSIVVSKTGIEQCIDEWRTNPKVLIQEKALTDLFLKTYPENTDIYEITIKVSALNTLYSTQLHKNIFAVIDHIKNLAIDKRLTSGDLSIVDDMIRTPLENGEVYRCYSFASKYCSFHRPDVFPIYDAYVDNVLTFLQQKDGFAGDIILNNRDYRSYVGAVNMFRTYYKLEAYSLKEIDKYLWQLGYELKQGES